MASSRTLKRRKQRKAAVVRRADNARWAALTDEQKKAEDLTRYIWEKMAAELMDSMLLNLERQGQILSRVNRGYDGSVSVDGGHVISVRRPRRFLGIVTDVN